MGAQHRHGHAAGNDRYGRLQRHGQSVQIGPERAVAITGHTAGDDRWGLGWGGLGLLGTCRDRMCSSDHRHPVGAEHRHGYVAGDDRSVFVCSCRNLAAATAVVLASTACSWDESDLVVCEV